MNEKGLISKRQLADITGYSFDWITKVVNEGGIVPTVIKESKDGYKDRSFFHMIRYRNSKSLKERQFMLFDDGQISMRAAA